MSGFADHFGGLAADYAQFRPRYPAALFGALAARAPARGLAVDVAAGSGQAASGLAPAFTRVVLVEPSVPQLREAGGAAARVAATAEALPLASGVADALVCAQALHWIDLRRFWPEVRRVVRPGGIVAVWCYVLARITPAVDALVERFYHRTVGPYWPPERVIVDEAYRGIDFPFREAPFPSVAMRQVLTLDAFAGYLGTWSAVRRYRAALAEDPVPPLRAELSPLWGDGAREVTWPLHGRLGIVS
ncbi:MAG: class I SAM-dependent methyltransferase [Gemmatimonadales bacterium]|nr:class I SAM-dependent methyltransferase [Gemmatimonadales bacterium]